MSKIGDPQIQKSTTNLQHSTSM